MHERSRAVGAGGIELLSPPMVPQHTNNPPDPSRSLSQEVQEQLIAGILSLADGGDTDASERLRPALVEAGREARSQKLTPEELILAFKQVELLAESRMTPAVRSRYHGDRNRSIRALLEAYYQP